MKTIASERTLLGMTQEDLASAIGCSRETVARWETGETTPRTSTVLKLANMFGCSVDYLLGKTQERVPR